MCVLHKYAKRRQRRGLEDGKDVNLTERYQVSTLKFPCSEAHFFIPHEDLSCALELREPSDNSTALARHFPPFPDGPIRRHLPGGRRSLAQLGHYLPPASGIGIRQLRSLHVLRARPASVSSKSHK